MISLKDLIAVMDKGIYVAIYRVHDGERNELIVQDRLGCITIADIEMYFDWVVSGVKAERNYDSFYNPIEIYVGGRV